MSFTSVSPPIEPAALVAGDDPRASSSLDRRDLLAIVGLLALTAMVFANALRGDFVLDDQKQIVRNDLIRLPAFWGTALTRDVWAFQGERETPWSNYWRPGHVAWLIVNYQLFGPAPFGWHLTSLLAHLSVVACAYVVVRWLGASWGVALAIVALFAIHPTRCESVAWIAGVHDVLATLGQLIALVALLSMWRRDGSARPLQRFNRAWRWAIAVACYVLAVATKEIAIFFPAIVAFVRYTDPPRENRRPAIQPALLAALPFAAVALVFLTGRQLVLGTAQIPFPGQPGPGTVIATLPLVLAYYLRQILFPYWIGWSYPVRAVTAANLGLWTFWAPLAIVIAALAAAQRLVRSRLAIVGAAIFVLTLLPALNLRGLHPEQLVKDRYLYMPLLGFLMMVVPAVAAGIRRLAGPQYTVPVAGQVLGVLVILLSLRTIQYNYAWRSELPLWQWAVWADPQSATNHEVLATAYMYAQRYPEARRAYDRALAINPHLTDAYINRAELALRERRYDDAVADCQLVLERFPDHVRALERLIIAREGQGRLEEAAEVCRIARERVPYRRAVFTDKLAVVLVKQNKRAEALAELESVRQEAETDYSPGSRLVLFHLGVLYHELGRPDEAAATLRRFLDLTRDTADPNLVAARRRAEATLGTIRG